MSIGTSADRQSFAERGQYFFYNFCLSVCFASISRNCFSNLNNSFEESFIIDEEIVAEPSITNRDKEASTDCKK